MRRSNSSSNIPVRKSQMGLKRANSFTQLAANVPRGSASGLLPKGYTTPNIANSARKSRITSKTTPLGPYASSRLSSPALLLTTQKINEKQFITDQQRKICRYLESNLGEFDPKSLKPLTLKTFVEIITILFEEIDPRINIKMENYKEIVFKYLKLYKYPGPLTMSMLKTVNANHTWPSVMAMFGWLVDLINDSNGGNSEDDKLKMYAASYFMETIKGNQPQGLFVNLLYDLLGIDVDEENKLKEENARLKEELDQKKQKVLELREKKEKLLKKYNEMQSEIMEFKEGKKEAKLQKELQEVKEENALKKREVKLIRDNIEKTKNILKNQKYSIKDKLRLIQKAEDMENTLTLKNERYEYLKELKNEYDYESTDLRRQIEAAVYKFNNRSLELSLLIPDIDVKQLRLPERGFHGPEFLKVVEEKKEVLQNVREKIKSRMAQVLEAESDAEKMLKEAHIEENKIRTNIENMKQQVESNTKEIERLIFEDDIVNKQRQKKSEALMKNAPDVETLKIKTQKAQDELEMLQEEFHNISEQSIAFFKNTYEDSKKNGKEMREIMSNILQGCHQTLEHVANQEADVLGMIENAKM